MKHYLQYFKTHNTKLMEHRLCLKGVRMFYRRKMRNLSILVISYSFIYFFFSNKYKLILVYMYVLGKKRTRYNIEYDVLWHVRLGYGFAYIYIYRSI